MISRARLVFEPLTVAATTAAGTVLVLHALTERPLGVILGAPPVMVPVLAGVGGLAISLSHSRFSPNMWWLTAALAVAISALAAELWQPYERLEQLVGGVVHVGNLRHISSLVSGLAGTLSLSALVAAINPSPIAWLDARLTRQPGWLVPTIVIASFCLIYAVHLSLKHLSFDTFAFDDGLFSHAVWQLSHGETPVSTIRGVAHVWGDHFTPILLLFVPLFWLAPTTLTLLLAQVILVGLAGYALWALGQRWLGSPTVSAALVVAYLGSVPMQQSLHFGFHPLTLAIPLLLAAIWATVEGRWRFSFALGLGLLLVQENVALYVLAFALWQGTIARGQDRWYPALLGLIAMGWLAVVLGWVIPAYRADAGYRYVELYGQFGDSFTAVLRSIALHPFAAIETLTDDPQKVRTLFVQLAPFGPLALLNPLSLIAAPMVAENLLANRSSQWLLTYHYAAPAATIFLVTGLATLRSIVERLRPSPAVRAQLTAFVALLLVGTTVLMSIALESPLFRRPRGQYPVPTARDEARRQLIATITSDATVVAQSALVPHLIGRSRLYALDPSVYPTGTTTVSLNADVVVVDRAVSLYPFDETGLRSEIGKLIAAGYGYAASTDTLLVLDRTSTQPLPPVWEQYVTSASLR